MAYENLKSAIKQAIKQNSNQEITGDLLQSTLLSMVDETAAEIETTAEIATAAAKPSVLTADVFKSTSEMTLSFANITGEGLSRMADVTVRTGFILWPRAEGIGKGFTDEFISGKTFKNVPYSYGALYAIFPKDRPFSAVRFECGGLAANGGIPKSITKNESYAIIAAWEESKVLFTIGDRHLIGKKQVTTFPHVIKPTALYSVCNKEKTNYSLKVFADHFVYKNSSRCLTFSNQNRQKAIYSKYNADNSSINSDVANTTKKIDIKTINDYVIAKDGTRADISFKHISTLNTETANKVCRLLCIGDSVTEGYLANKNMPYNTAPKQYWAWVKSLFEIDKINNKGVGYFFESLGNIVNCNFDIKFSNVEKSGIKAYACGVGGSRTQNWLSAKLNNGITNPFYNVSTSKFSLKYWVEKYRTLIVNADGTTTRCTDNNKGLLAGDVNAANVCEPTHVLIQLGYNQIYDSINGDNRNGYLADISTMIYLIKEEYPNTIIMLSLPDTAGGYSTSEEFVDEGYDIHSIDWTKGTSKWAHDAFAFMNLDIMDICDEQNVFYVPSFFASPCEYGAATRESNDFAFIASGNNAQKLRILTGYMPQLHPNNVAHASIGYQIYSLIKYTLVK